MSQAERITQGLQWLDGHRGATAEEFWRGMRPDGAALLDGLVSLGYVERDGQALEVTVAGFRRLHELSVEVTS